MSTSLFFCVICRNLNAYQKYSNVVLTFKSFVMAESVYKVIELVGTSTESWEKAAAAAINKAAETLRDLRVAEVSKLDLVINDGKVEAYRARLTVSFKYEAGK